MESVAPTPRVSHVTTMPIVQPPLDAEEARILANQLLDEPLSTTPPLPLKPGQNLTQMRAQYAAMELATRFYLNMESRDRPLILGSAEPFAHTIEQYIFAAEKLQFYLKDYRTRDSWPDTLSYDPNEATHELILHIVDNYSHYRLNLISKSEFEGQQQQQLELLHRLGYQEGADALFAVVYRVVDGMIAASLNQHRSADMDRAWRM